MNNEYRSVYGSRTNSHYRKKNEAMFRDSTCKNSCLVGQLNFVEIIASLSSVMSSSWRKHMKAPLSVFICLFKNKAPFLFFPLSKFVSKSVPYLITDDVTISGLGSFAVQFGNHFWSRDHFRYAIICGSVQGFSIWLTHFHIY